MTDRATKVIYRSLMVVISVLALLGPSFSQAFCATGCTGGQCEPLVTEFQCDLAAFSSSCDQSNACDEVPVVNPAIPGIAGDCQPCGCFDQEQMAMFLLPKNETAAQASPATLTSPTALSPDRMSLAGYLPAAPFGQRTHAPPIPIYRLTHTLLI